MYDPRIARWLRQLPATSDHTSMGRGIVRPTAASGYQTPIPKNIFSDFFGRGKLFQILHLRS
jgi:hypothetical protein